MLALFPRPIPLLLCFLKIAIILSDDRAPPTPLPSVSSIVMPIVRVFLLMFAGPSFHRVPVTTYTHHNVLSAPRVIQHPHVLSPTPRPAPHATAPAVSSPHNLLFNTTRRLPFLRTPIGISSPGIRTVQPVLAGQHISIGEAAPVHYGPRLHPRTKPVHVASLGILQYPWTWPRHWPVGRLGHPPVVPAALRECFASAPLR